MALQLKITLTDRLRHLLACARNESPRGLIHYQDCINGKSPLLEFSAGLTDEQGGGVFQIQYSGVKLFLRSLLRRILLVQFRLFCVSTELQDDVEYAFGELKSLCEFVEHHNGREARQKCCRSKCNVHFQFADFVDILVSCRSPMIAEMILQDLTPENVVRIAQFESIFIRALLGVCGTYTSLLTRPPQRDKQHKMVFVSEEMFSMAQHSQLTWLDCLIPGAQSDYLRAIGQQLTARIWKKVATELLARAQPLVLGVSIVERMVSQISQAMEHQDLEHHTAVTKCLWYTVSAIEHQQKMANWDKGFQSFLATTPQDSRKGFKAAREQTTTKSTSLLVSDVLPHLASPTRTTTSHPTQRDVVPKAATVSQHVDTLTLSMPLSRAFVTSVNLSTSYIVQGLRGALANWNLRTLAQLLFIDGPVISNALTQVANTVAGTACPQFSFPLCSSLHAIEHRSRSSFSIAHDRCVKFKESLESFSTAFHDIWSERCANVLQTVFPPSKFWKSLGKRHKIHQIKPSGYCSNVVEGLMLPIVEVAGGLPEDTQAVFVGLVVCVLMNELRKVITSNKKTYTAAAGRQILADFRHLWHQLTSGELGRVWCKQSSHLLSTLPVKKEMEHGIFILCGTASQNQLEEHSNDQHDQIPFYSTLPFPHLPIFSELAWHSEKDWTQCIA